MNELVQYPDYADIAFRELILHVSEIPGPDANDRILDYFKATSLEPYKGDETAWCAAGINWVLKVDGIAGTNLANARSFQNWGVEISPRRGAIVPLWRISPEDWRGHVGILLDWDHTYVSLLAGNHGKVWSVKRFKRERVLSFRWATLDMRFT